ncbi:MAG TPA: 50S ribosomal protein L28 [Caldisericia bacterium]|nr:50S ribosomal protein L28 [Caldisericia bacterium]HPF49315.1 50S ribosomal protein L28 [Caldisericia bacterium]HPI84005.1 50S ribosomal protein L28 [Caldisericia bacterium]HPQ93263.1 50S ribosomal protein L28 [Caldisericia bacterium]HRV75355.1 50S ribosomal protein L28 [Caldisericia bacterium]
MSKKCEICGKGPITGHTISHSHVRCKRRWLPNLHSVRADLNGTVKRVQVCSKCLKAGKVKVA